VRVFGIDCGTECTGYGVVDLDETGREARLAAIASGGIRLPKKQPLAYRLATVHAELSKLIAAFEPDVVAVEEVFYSVNAQSALKLGHVRGVALLAAADHGLDVVEYAPLKIKSSVVGFGLAKKEQVQYMVARLLDLPEPPQPADAADALAIAICHLHYAQTARNQGAGLVEERRRGQQAGGESQAAASRFPTVAAGIAIEINFAARQAAQHPVHQTRMRQPDEDSALRPAYPRKGHL